LVGKSLKRRLNKSRLPRKKDDPPKETSGSLLNLNVLTFSALKQLKKLLHCCQWVVTAVSRKTPKATQKSGTVSSGAVKYFV
jgi:hypothetical protein